MDEHECMYLIFPFRYHHMETVLIIDAKVGPDKSLEL